MIISDEPEMIFGDDVDPKEEMREAERAASDREQKRQEDKLKEKLKVTRPCYGKDEDSLMEEDDLMYDPPQPDKKIKTSVKNSVGGGAPAQSETKNSVTFPSSMWPPGMTKDQVSSVLMNIV